MLFRQTAQRDFGLLRSGFQMNRQLTCNFRKFVIEKRSPSFKTGRHRRIVGFWQQISRKVAVLVGK